MKTRILAACAAMLSLAGVSTALAVEGNPVSGIGVSVESSPGGIMIPTGDCAQKGGKLEKRVDGKWICKLPRTTTGPTISTTTPAPRGKPPTGN
jgi:hypothetical protein